MEYNKMNQVIEFCYKLNDHLDRENKRFERNYVTFTTKVEEMRLEKVNFLSNILAITPIGSLGYIQRLDHANIKWTNALVKTSDEIFKYSNHIEEESEKWKDSIQQQIYISFSSDDYTMQSLDVVAEAVKQLEKDILSIHEEVCAINNASISRSFNSQEQFEQLLEEVDTVDRCVDTVRQGSKEYTVPLNEERRIYQLFLLQPSVPSKQVGQLTIEVTELAAKLATF